MAKFSCSRKVPCHSHASTASATVASSASLGPVSNASGAQPYRNYNVSAKLQRPQVAPVVSVLHLAAVTATQTTYSSCRQIFLHQPHFMNETRYTELCNYPRPPRSMPMSSHSVTTKCRTSHWVGEATPWMSWRHRPCRVVLCILPPNISQPHTDGMSTSSKACWQVT